MSYWDKDLHIEQWNTIGSPQINTNAYSQLIFSKGANKIQLLKWQTFQQVVQGQLDKHMKKMN